MLLAMIVAPVAQTAVVPVLPSLSGEFDVSASAVSWVMTANLLAAAVGTPLLGRLGDARGHKPVLVGCLLVAAAGASLAALAHSFPLLLAARVLQGAGAGVLPLAISVLRAELPRDRVAGGLATVSVSMGLGSALGVVASGVLMSMWPYQSVFWLMALLGVAALLPVVTGVPARRGQRGTGGGDPWGTVTLAAWLVALLIAISEGNAWGWTDWRIIALLCAAGTFLVVWCLVERRVRHPIVDLSMLASRTVALSNAAGALTGFAMYGAFIAMTSVAQAPVEMGIGFGATVLGAGLMLLPNSLGNLTAGVVGRVTLSRRGPRPTLALGGLLSAAGVGMLAVWHDVGVLYLASGLFGIGTGLAFAAIPTYINDAVPGDRTGVANGMNAVVRTIGAATGSAVTGALLSGDRVAGTQWPTQAAYQTAFAVTAAAFAVTVLIPFSIRRSA
jgi:MFS family permease